MRRPLDHPQVPAQKETALASCNHKWGPFNNWTNTCAASRSRVCEICGDFDIETKTEHAWITQNFEGKPSKIICGRCGQPR